MFGSYHNDIMEVTMKTVNGVRYTDKEWKLNQIGILAASFIFIWGFILLWWFLG